MHLGTINNLVRQAFEFNKLDEIVSDGALQIESFLGIYSCFTFVIGSVSN